MILISKDGILIDIAPSIEQEGNKITVTRADGSVLQYFVEDGLQVLDVEAPVGAASQRWQYTDGEWAELPELEAPAEAIEPFPTGDITAQITALKAQLSATDYQCLKWAEGWLSTAEYEPIKAARQELRERINELEQTGTQGE